MFADLAIIPFVVALFAPLMKGNIVRMIIAGIFELIVGFYIASSMADIFTSAAQSSGFKMPENAVKLTSIGDGFLWTQWFFTRMAENLGIIGLLIIAVLLAVVWFFYMKNQHAWEVAAGAPEN